MSSRSKPSRVRRARRAIIGAAAGVVVLSVLGALIATGAIWPGRVFAAGYTVRGVDVSSYQGRIDWNVLAGEGIDFAYIKTTEGSSAVDSRFADNWQDAQDTDLLVGAYHFLSFETSGEEQARHIIETVPDDGDLPIAIDVEFYGDYFDDPPSRAAVTAILDPLLAVLEQHDGSAPVLYATPAAYDLYLAEAYPDNPLWIRSVVVPPRLEEGSEWTFWQYSPRDRLDGYDGDEPFIDMNVFAGTRTELAELG